MPDRTTVFTMIGVLLRRLNELNTRVAQDGAGAEDMRRETAAIADQWGHLMAALRALRGQEAGSPAGWGR
jgi:hypothetical protein